MMLDMKQKTPFGSSRHEMSKRLQVWDVPYLTSKARNSWLNLNTSDIAEYFSLGVCMEGLNMLYSQLFQVSLEVEDTDPGELWHPDVYKLAVRDLQNNGSLMGHIYCDFFSREDKAFQVSVVFIFMARGIEVPLYLVSYTDPTNYNQFYYHWILGLPFHNTRRTRKQRWELPKSNCCSDAQPSSSILVNSYPLKWSSGRQPIS